MLQSMSRTEAAQRGTEVLSVAFLGAVVAFTAMVSEVDRAKRALLTLITTLAALYSVALELQFFVCKCLGTRPGRSALPLQKFI